MIIDTIENISRYVNLNKYIRSAIEFLSNSNEYSAEGRYEIDGDNVYANITKVSTVANSEYFEAHKKYLDLQVVIKGSEILKYPSISQCTQIMDYDENSDCYFFEGTGSEIHIKEGMFYLLYPTDAHASGIRYNDDHLKKIVIKIKY